MNTASSISAFISPLAAAWIFTRFGSFAAMLISAGAVYLIASLLWFRVDATQAITPPQVNAGPATLHDRRL
jgi:hypothetical protein